MKIRYFLCLLPCIVLAPSCTGGSGNSNFDESEYISVPFRGNTYVTGAAGDIYNKAVSTIDSGSGALKNWNDASTVLSFYVRTSATGDMALAIKAHNVQDTHSCTLTFTDGESSYDVTVASKTPVCLNVGTFKVSAPGYKKIDIKAKEVSPAAAQFARIDKYLLKGSALQGKNCYLPENKVDDNSLWCRRGPSVHLFYTLPQEDVEWFYNEVTVPEGSDVPGSYFMLTGFREGYMGIQSHPEGQPNTVLFSVWSPQETDDASAVSEDKKVKLLRQGKDVEARDFGGEGTGGQSFMNYPWKTGISYKTLVQVRPTGTGATDYTGYFCDEKGEWHLLASFRRPQTDTWYMGAYSFLECFVPETSIYAREARFHNQWVRLRDGSWKKISSARFSCDNTGISGFRGDMYGAQEGEDLVLRHCGFFPEQTMFGTTFAIPQGGSAPQIDFAALERL